MAKVGGEGSLSFACCRSSTLSDSELAIEREPFSSLMLMAVSSLLCRTARSHYSVARLVLSFTAGSRIVIRSDQGSSPVYSR